MMIQGRENIDSADLSGLNLKVPYDAGKDIMFWQIPPKMNRLTLNAGDYVVLPPETAHRCAICVGAKEHVVKIVGKVRMN